MSINIGDKYQVFKYNGDSNPYIDTEMLDQPSIIIITDIIEYIDPATANKILKAKYDYVGGSSQFYRSINEMNEHVAREQLVLINRPSMKIKSRIGYLLE